MSKSSGLTVEIMNVSCLGSWCVSLVTASSTTSTKARTKNKVWRNRYRPVQGRNFKTNRTQANKNIIVSIILWSLYDLLYRQEKEAWIKAKYVEKKFLKKLGSTEILINGERKSERRWSVKKCRRHNSATTVPKTRRRYRQEPGSTSPSTLSAGTSVVLDILMSGSWRLILLWLITLSDHISSSRCLGERTFPARDYFKVNWIRFVLTGYFPSCLSHSSC